MKIKVTPQKISGALRAIPSKSYLIRALILAMLSNKHCKINGLYMSNDVVNTLKVINSLGATVIVNGDMVEVIPPHEIKDNAHINVGESATLLRLIVSVLCVLNKRATVEVSGSLLLRDVYADFAPLINAGAKITNSFPIVIEKGVEKFEFNIEDSKTSGIVSGLLIGLSKTGGKVHINKGDFNGGYIDMTKEILEDFSAEVIEGADGFLVKKSELFKDEYNVEGDFSNATPFLIMGALFGDCSVENLSLNTQQSDKGIVEILKGFGASVTIENDKITVSRGELRPNTFDMSKNLDIVPALSAFASQISGTTIFQNIEKLRYKESDRIESIITLLSLFGKRAEFKDNNLYIYGTTDGKFAKMRLPNDHRILMSALILGLVYGAEIEGVECINKSYPTFFEDVEIMGGKIEWIK